MQKPSGSNLEILAQLPSFFDELIKENTEMKERLKKLESQKEPEKSLASIKQYDDTDLKEQLADAVRLCKRDDSQYRSIAEQLDIVKNECLKACKAAEYDDSGVKESIKNLASKLESIKPFDDGLLKKQIAELSKALNDIKPYSDQWIKSELKKINESLSLLKNYDDKAIVGQISKVSDRITFVENALGVK